MRPIWTAALAAMAALGGTPAEAALVVSDDATSNVQCGAGICTATAADAVLNVHDLKVALAAGDLTVSAGSDAADISIDTQLAWANAHRLTLSAFRSVLVSRAVTVQGTAGVTVTPNAGGGGDLVFKDTGSLSFWDLSSSLVVAGAAYTLVNDVDGLAKAVATDPAGHYALAQSFDAENAVYRIAAIRTTFDGTFTGLGHAIANVHIRVRNDAAGGFFGAIGDPGAAVRDLTLRNLVLVPENDPVNGVAGALAGVNEGLVSNVTIDGGSVDARSARHRFADRVGGMLGANASSGIVSRSRVVGTLVFGTRITGGMVGQNFGRILRSHAEATVQGTSRSVVGGLVGSLHGDIVRSSSAGSVSMAADRKGSDGSAQVGGLVGEGTGTVDRSFSTASVDGGSGATAHNGRFAVTAVGGLVGAGNGLDILNSYARGPVSANDGADHAEMGGLSGVASSNRIQHSYAAGAVTCRDCTNQIVGGFAGYTGNLHVNRSYWDTEASGQAIACGQGDCPEVAGRTTAKLTDGLPRGFDSAIWAQSPGINDGYPYLIDNPPQ
ncbi:MAG: hypothetical protein JOZ72_19105 [Alphaproteobacteria bacterium]|nr:hypothetical protein [Alphaproteobacteria bacterium]